jgi:hypothetical protein
MMNLHAIDNRLIVLFDAFAGYLQERVGLTMALILREISMGAIFANGFLIYTLSVTGDWMYLALYIPFAGSALQMFIRDYRKHMANTERDWTESLARKYLLEADKKRTVYGMQRLVVFGLAAFQLGLILYRGGSIFEMENLSVMLLFIVFGMREYVTCAHPRPPGSRSRQSQGSLGFGGAC